MKIIIKLQEYALYIFLFSLNFETMNLFHLGIDYLATKITLCFLFFLSLLNYKSNLSFRYFSKYLIPLLTYFMLLTLISYVNRSPGFTVFFDFLFFLNILIFLILINKSIIKPEVLLRGLFVFALSTFVLSILYFLGFGITESIEGLEGRATVFGMNQNFLGVNLCVSLLILMSMIFENQLKFGKYRYLLLITFPFLLGFMIKTGSRLAILSLVLGIVVLLFFNKTINARKKIRLILFILFLFSLIWQLVLKNSLVVERLFETVNEGDLANRDMIWISLLIVFSENFIFGVGKTGYEMVTGGISPHNVIIEVLCYTGIVGLMIFIFFLFRIIQNSFKRIKYNGELLPIALVIPILGIVLSGQIFDHKLFWVLFAYIGGSTAINSNKIIIKKNSTINCNSKRLPVSEHDKNKNHI